MRKINNDFTKTPPKLLGCAKKHEPELLKTKNISSNCYKKSKQRLEKQFHNKCAYCETEYLATSDTWIEHYRPKSEYYWLAYEWSNLIPTCTKCNRKKKDYFPLINAKNKVRKPPLLSGKLDISKCKADTSPLIDEQPFVLHPKIDNPQEYFDFKIDDNFTGIKIIGIDKVNDSRFGRGDKTIDICDLNRKILKIDRYRKVISDIVIILQKTFRLLQLCDVPLCKYEKAFSIEFKVITIKANQTDLEHTLLRKIITDKNKFIEIICKAIENETVRKYIETVYRKYK